MHVFELTFCLAVYTFGVGVQANAQRDDLAVGYYWRQYIRDIPHDALPGGIDKRGKTTYIGQTVHKDCENQVVVTGQILEAEQKMMYEWGYKKNVASNQVQILCSHTPEHFRWIKTTPVDIKTLKNVHLVPGGIEKNYAVYIGRVLVDGEIGVGKVLVSDDYDFKGLYTVMNDQYLHEKKNFEVLAYDPNLSKKEKPQTMKLKSDGNSSSMNIVWQPILIVAALRTLYSSFT